MGRGLWDAKKRKKERERIKKKKTEGKKGKKKKAKKGTKREGKSTWRYRPHLGAR